ncbi:hypothetical protein [Erwinia tasmaniensis]|nr:hypothetical protein [Erwinia tasmaniensis]
MQVNFINKDIINIHLKSLTRGNISSKTFHSILDKIKNVDNIPKSFEKVLSKKAEKHHELKSKISYAYHNRADSIYSAGIEKQNEILKKETTNTDDSEEKLYKLSKEMFSHSSLDFRKKVLFMFERGFDHSTPNKTKEFLCHARSELSSAKRMLSNNTCEQNGYSPKKMTAIIERLTQKVFVLEKKYLEDKYTLTKTIISAAEANPHLLSTKMGSCMTKIEDEINKYLATPHISKQVENNIEKLTKLKSENQQQMEEIDGLILLNAANAVVRDTNSVLKEVYHHNDKLNEEINKKMNDKIEHIMKSENKRREEIAEKISSHPEVSNGNTAVDNEVIKLPDVPTHKPISTRGNRVKFKPVEG